MPQTPPRSSTTQSNPGRFLPDGRTPYSIRSSTVDFTRNTDIREEEIRIELDGKIIEVDAEAFIKAFLYPSDLANFAKDVDFGNKFRFPRDLPIYGKAGYSGNEKGLQAFLVIRFEYIRKEWAAQHDSPDWLEPSVPPVEFKNDSQVIKNIRGHSQPPRQSTIQEKALRKTFVITGDKRAQFSRSTHRHLLHLGNDISLWVRIADEGTDDETEDKIPEAHHDKPAPRSEESPSWKDLPFIIEVKTERLKAAHMLQVASYLQAMKFEQYDRSFFFLATITDDEFRIWRWDSGCCYVTEPIFYRAKAGQPLPYPREPFAGSSSKHAKPTENQPKGAGLPQLVRIIGRITSMSPLELGYDPSFENAGRVVSTMRGGGTARTILKITPPEGQPERRYLVRRPIFERYDSIFSRCTRVWRVRALDSKPDDRAVIIKQGWEDVTRPSEIAIYERIKAIQDPESFGLVTVSAHQGLGAEGDHGRTFDWVEHEHDRELSPNAIKGYYRLKKDLKAQSAGWEKSFVPSSSLPQIAHRSLTRFVFDEEYLPLSTVRSPLELLYVLRDVVLAIGKMHEHGILHRDISSGNIMLRKTRWNETGRPEPGKTAVLIDYGLALVKASESEGEAERSDVHTHISGTLPFMAVERLNEAVKPPHIRKPILHRLDHDLESVYWVALCFITDDGRCTPNYEFKQIMSFIKTKDPTTVLQSKLVIMESSIQGIRSGDFELPGPCVILEKFFRALPRLWNNRIEELSVDNVISEIDDASDASSGRVEYFDTVSTHGAVVGGATGEKRATDGADCGDTESECSQRRKKTKL